MSKRGFFTKVDNHLLRSELIKPHELAVYLNIRSRQGNKLTAWPSHSTIARETSMSVSKVKSCIKSLEAMGLLSVKHRYITPGRMTSNEYRSEGFLNRFPKTDPQASESYKEDSVKEYSSANSSTASNKRSWRHLDPEKRATIKQLEYLEDLVLEFGDPEGLFNGDGQIEWNAMNQVEADRWIELYYIHKSRSELYG